VSSRRGKTPVGIVIVRAMVIVVPLVVMFMVGVISILVMILDLVACIIGTNGIPQVLSTLTLAALIQRERHVASRVPTWDLVMVEVLTSPPISSVKGRVHHCSNIQHRMEVLDLRVYIHAILRQQGCEFIDYDPRGQSIVCKRVVNLLAMLLDPADFFVKHSRLIPKSFLVYRTLLIELGVVPSRGGTILSFILGCS
jgi:hypothetical protein